MSVPSESDKHLADSFRRKSMTQTEKQCLTPRTASAIRLKRIIPMVLFGVFLIGASGNAASLSWEPGPECVTEGKDCDPCPSGFEGNYGGWICNKPAENPLWAKGFLDEVAENPLWAKVLEDAMMDANYCYLYPSSKIKIVCADDKQGEERNEMDANSYLVYCAILRHSSLRHSSKYWRENCSFFHLHDVRLPEEEYYKALKLIKYPPPEPEPDYLKWYSSSLKQITLDASSGVRGMWTRTIPRHIAR
ncbi:hypothetical protein [Thioalkalivibrio sp. HK1]|uniref:hypothetical protein n=1 Tax=Thioalkalivibrio sp. HK1 TaxID=1469245 RepID=UPI0012DCA77D|nr:hypothetical protein [Thioalkalivibrio sp. HK1]